MRLAHCNCVGRGRTRVGRTTNRTRFDCAWVRRGKRVRRAGRRLHLVERGIPPNPPQCRGGSGPNGSHPAQRARRHGAWVRRPKHPSAQSLLRGPCAGSRTSVRGDLTGVGDQRRRVAQSGVERATGGRCDAGRVDRARCARVADCRRIHVAEHARGSGQRRRGAAKARGGPGGACDVGYSHAALARSVSSSGVFARSGSSA